MSPVSAFNCLCADRPGAGCACGCQHSPAVSPPAAPVACACACAGRCGCDASESGCLCAAPPAAH
ncbi:hypothetical protein [Ottowia sp.]|uniref:hypothetical protein n=1 Tax=Ottowia sp. TaxID=1898956 RepID=UPI0025DCC5DB|nr:hypothetical protein [Ottowia sp.]